MKTLIIPDLHEPSAAVLDCIEDLIRRERPDRTVFLGDYFDQYNDGPADTERMASWLSNSLGKENRVHLIGNHDASYFWPCDTTYCPGFTWEKEAVVQRILGAAAHARFQFHTWIEGWLLTHAGLAAAWVPEGIDVAPWLESEARNAWTAFAQDRDHWFLATGSLRGGRQRAGGILWADWREPRWPGRQIFGHTPAAVVRQDSTAICLDTNLGKGPQHAVVLIDGVPTVRPIRAA